MVWTSSSEEVQKKNLFGALKNIYYKTGTLVGGHNGMSNVWGMASFGINQKNKF